MTKSLRDAKSSDTYSLDKITVTATLGTLPVANGAVTIADAATPTNAELLELCMELKAKIDTFSN